MSTIGAVSLVLACLCCAGWAGDLLTLQPHYASYPSTAQSTYVVAEIKTPASDRHVPVDLVVVVDRSGSMAGEKKMPLVQETLRRALPLLREEDHMGIVAFSDDAEMMLPLTADREAAKHAIDRLQPLGSTNLGAGVFRALDMLKEKRKGSVCALAVLTDGLANAGLLRSNLDAALKERNTPCVIHTFGYGADHDVAFLKQLADGHRGSYFFVEKPHEVGELFGLALGSVQSMWAEEAELVLVPSGWHAIKRVLGKQVSISQDGAKWRVGLGSLLAEQTRRVVVEIALASKPSGSFLIGTLQYARSANNWSTAVTTIDVVRTVEAAPGAINIGAETEVQRARASDVFLRADGLARQGKRKEGRDVLNAFLLELEGSPARAQLQAVVDDVKRARDGLRDEQAWMNFGSQFLATNTLTNGQVVIGSTGFAPARAVLTSASLRMDPDEL
jgi:uncharacterized protein YegL